MRPSVENKGDTARGAGAVGWSHVGEGSEALLRTAQLSLWTVGSLSSKQETSAFLKAHSSRSVGNRWRWDEIGHKKTT